MKGFLLKHSEKILGVLSGFDRLIFRGCIRQLMYEKGMSTYLNIRGILLKEFKDYARYYSAEFRFQTEKYVKANNRPFIWLPSAKESKEKMAREIANRDGINKGLVCVLSVLEPCYSYKVIGNRSIEKLQIIRYQTKCLHFYHYWIDPLFGLMHGRIQSWYPFNIQYYLNGKEWLRNQMIKKGLSFVKNDNCFTRVDNFNVANELSKKQLEHDWQKTLNRFSRNLTPIHEEIFPMGWDYYWTIAQSEWAVDVLFKDRESLKLIYPDLIHHSMETFQSKDVMRFLGKRMTSQDNIHGGFKGEVISNLKERPEGIRVKHGVKSNSVKLYDKAGSVLRAEGTINNPSEFKVYRFKESSGKNEWQPMRKSVKDIARRAEVSQKAVSRQLEALTFANVGEKFPTILDSVTYPIKKGNLKVRGLDPFTKDRDLLGAIIKGEFSINGFRNRDIRKQLFKPTNKEETKRCSAKITRMFKLLRSHGIIKKVPRTHRYLVTKKGTQLISAITTIQNTNLNDLLKLAA